MWAHFRANLWLLILSMLMGSVLYPLALLIFGRTFFPEKAEGSLLRDQAGKIIGSRLIAQPFTGEQYFWPRPSAASYKPPPPGLATGAPTTICCAIASLAHWVQLSR